MATLSEAEQVSLITQHALELDCTIKNIHFVSDREAIVVEYTDEKDYENTFRTGAHWEPHQEKEDWIEEIHWCFTQREAIRPVDDHAPETAEQMEARIRAEVEAEHEANG